MKNKWTIVHDCDDDNGNPTCWSLEINHPQYGRYVWIAETETGYDVQIERSSIETIANCKTLSSAKRWVTSNLT